MGELEQEADSLTTSLNRELGNELHSLTRSLAASLTRSLAHSLPRSLAYSLTRSLDHRTRSLIHTPALTRFASLI